MNHALVKLARAIDWRFLAGIGFAAHVSDGSGTATATVVKPGKPVTASVGEPRTVR
jgi:hypothetical protein